LRLDVSDLRKISKMILKGSFRPVPHIKCAKPDRAAFTGKYKDRRVVVVFKKTNNRVTTFLPISRAGFECDSLASLGDQMDFDKLFKEKGRQMPPLN